MAQVALVICLALQPWEEGMAALVAPLLGLLWEAWELLPSSQRLLWEQQLEKEVMSSLLLLLLLLWLQPWLPLPWPAAHQHAETE